MLDTIDLSLSMEVDEYNRELIKYQIALHSLAYQVYLQQRPVVMVFEDGTRLEKVVQSVGLRKRLTREGFSFIRLQHLKGMMQPIIIYGGSGGDCQKQVRSLYLTAVGTVG